MKYFENASHMIMDAMKAGEKQKAETYKLMKNEFLKWKTSANNVGKELTDKDEFTIIKKMIKERTDAAGIYEQAGRKELAEKELMEISYLKPLLPAGPSEDDVRKVIKVWLDERKLTGIEQNQMGQLMGYIKSNVSGVDGSMASAIVKTYIGK